MGAWGTAIFADDFACDVREDYLARLANGAKPGAASRDMRAEYGAMADDDEGPIFWLALAATQWEYGALDAMVKRRALAIITRGADAATWLEGGPDKRRLAALAALGKKLRTKPPPPKRPKRRRVPVEQPSSPPVPSPNGSAIATAYAIDKRIAQVAIEIPSLGGGGGVFVAECAHDAIHLRWRGESTLEISYPAKAHVEPAIGDPKKFFHSGRTIALKLVKRR